MMILLYILILAPAITFGSLQEKVNELSDDKGKWIWNVMSTSYFSLSLDANSSMGERPRLSVEVDSRRIFALDVDTTNNLIVLTLPSNTIGSRILPIRAPLNTNEIQHIILRVNGSEVALLANCRQLILLKDEDLSFNSTRGPSEVRLFSRGALHSDNGYNLIVVPLNESQLTCDKLEIIIDNYVPYYATQEKISFSRLSRVEHQLSQLKSFMGRIDKRLHNLEQNHRCKWQDTTMTVGQKRIDNDQCKECTCGVDGQLVCGDLGCPSVNCSRPERAPGECCPACRKTCLFNNRVYEHGEEAHPKTCESCLCIDGEMSCKYTHPSSCPPLNCTEQIQPENFCCPICENRHYCAEHNPCHKYAICSNKNHRAECTCELGFIGNGTHCYDMDECLWNKDAREQLGGCTDGSICVNLPGTFRCDCLPGFIRLSERSCLNLMRF